MSDFVKADSARVSAVFSPLDMGGDRPPFVAWTQKYASDLDDGADDATPAEATIDVDAIRQAAFDEGYGEGRRTVEKEVDAERHAVVHLAEALDQYRPEPPADLALLLAETVDRLVRQIVGEVVIDAALLDKRVAAVAQLIADAAAPRRMRLHPDDIKRLEGAELDVEIVPDAGMLPGSVFVETGTGWVEDGPDVGLEKLRQALERMGISQ